MTKLLQAFDDCDVMSAAVTGAMESSTSMTTPQSEIEDLMREVADENQLEFGEAIARPTAGGVKTAAAQEDEDDELLARLKKLKAPQ